MKTWTRFLLLVALVGSLTGCLFKEPVFKEGFAKVDPALGGVWASEDAGGDPRKTEYAVCAPLDDDRYVLHHPTDKEGIYYEARLMKVRDRRLLQLRALASFGNGLPKADAECYTLLWIEKDLPGATIRVRALDDDHVKGKGPAEVKRILEDPAGDWNSLFGESVTFRRLKDN